MKKDCDEIVIKASVTSEAALFQPKRVLAEELLNFSVKWLKMKTEFFGFILEKKQNP